MEGEKMGEKAKVSEVNNLLSSLKRIQEQNPLNKYVMTQNGFIIPKDFLEE